MENPQCRACLQVVAVRDEVVETHEWRGILCRGSGAPSASEGDPWTCPQCGNTLRVAMGMAIREHLAERGRLCELGRTTDHISAGQNKSEKDRRRVVGIWPTKPFTEPRPQAPKSNSKVRAMRPPPVVTVRSPILSARRPRRVDVPAAASRSAAAAKSMQVRDAEIAARRARDDMRSASGKKSATVKCSICGALPRSNQRDSTGRSAHLRASGAWCAGGASPTVEQKARVQKKRSIRAYRG